MTMVVDFADGFTSNTIPNLLGLGNETFIIENNHPTIFENFTGLDFSSYSSVFATYEVERENGSNKYRQSGEVMFRKNSATNTWEHEFGAFLGDDLVQASEVTSPEHVVIDIDDSGQVIYLSGEMDDYLYTGFFKLNINRINA